MPTNANIPPTRDEVIAEIASILAQGCLRLRKSRGISPEIGNEAGKGRWCMNRNWPATNPTHRSITYQERTTMAYRARPSG